RFSASGGSGPRATGRGEKNPPRGGARGGKEIQRATGSGRGGADGADDSRTVGAGTRRAEGETPAAGWRAGRGGGARAGGPRGRRGRPRVGSGRSVTTTSRAVAPLRARPETSLPSAVRTSIEFGNALTPWSKWSLICLGAAASRWPYAGLVSRRLACANAWAGSASASATTASARLIGAASRRSARGARRSVRGRGRSRASR